MLKNKIKKLDKIEKELIETPLDDKEIKKYLKNPKILKISELKKYNNIDELLPNEKDYTILLYESSKNVGHWVGLLKYNNTIEFFCSIADDGRPDSQLFWIDNSINENLGQFAYLTRLLLNSDYDVIYNKLKFQKQSDNKNNVNCCGRHCCFRIINLINHNMNLKQYQKYMKDLKKKSKNNYDELVTHLINEFIIIE